MSVNIYIPFKQATINQKIWLHNVDGKALVIDWGDGSAIETVGEIDNEYVSHIYTEAGVYTIHASYEDVWGDDLGNTLLAETSAGDFMVLMDSGEITITDAITIEEPITYQATALDNAFLSLSLPFTAVDVGSNEFAVVDNINAALYKLDLNTAYLLEQTTIIDPTVPNVYLGWLSGGPGITNRWHIDQAGYDEHYLTPGLSGSYFSNITEIKTKEFDTVSYIYLIDNNNIKILNGLTVDAMLVTQTSSIGFNEPFTNLVALDLDDIGNIFILDNWTVYKSQFNAITNRIESLAQIGGSGTGEDHYLFQNPGDIMVDNDDRVYVVDSDNLCVKVYTNKLIWTNTLVAENFTIYNKPIKICVNKVTNDVYVLTSSRDLVTYNADLEFVSSISLLESSNSTALIDILETETIYKIFADNDDNYLYAVTETATIKFTKTGRLINKIEAPTSEDFFDLRAGCIDSHGQLFIAKTDRVFWLFDPISSISLKRSTSAPIALSAINLNETGHEFIQDWVYNKAIKKLLRNLVVLNGSLQLKIVVSFDLDGSLRSFYVRPLALDETTGITINLSDFLNVNEFVLSDTVNRVLGNMLDHQKNVLNTIKPGVIFVPSAAPYPILP